MTSVVITQPMLFPWPGYYEQLQLADVYIYLDDAQYSKGSLTNRIQIKHPAGRKWMTIPLLRGGSFMRIDKLAATDSNWRVAHLELIRQSFSEAPYMESALDIIEKTYKLERLVDVLIDGTEALAQALNIGSQRHVFRASKIGVDGASWRRVLDIVKAVGGTKYITGHGAAKYLDHCAFEAEGVAVEYMDYSRTAWPQHNGPFDPHVTCLDLLAYTGKDANRYLKPGTVPWRRFLRERGLLLE